MWNRMRKGLLLTALLPLTMTAQETKNYVSQVWCPDNGDGTYTNPVINADYSDPDVCVGASGEDFYMTASSFQCTPGLPILHSKDLVNWEIVNYAIGNLYEVRGYGGTEVRGCEEIRGYFDGAPQHGKGVWAPSIRYHDGWYYIYWGDPDFGVMMVKTQTPEGEWTKPVCIIPGQGYIDTCPLWDDDGHCYLVNGWANSRSKFASVLTVREMSADGLRPIGQPVIVTATVRRTARARVRNSISAMAGTGLCVRQAACLTAFSWPCVASRLMVLTSTRRCWCKAKPISMVHIRAVGYTQTMGKTGSCISRTRRPTVAWCT